MRITCEKCGENISMPNKKHQIRKSANKNHSIVTCKHCGHKNFVDTVTRFNAKRDSMFQSEF